MRSGTCWRPYGVEDDANGLPGRVPEAQKRHLSSNLVFESLKMEVRARKAEEFVFQGVWKALGSVLDHSGLILGPSQPARGLETALNPILRPTLGNKQYLAVSANLPRALSVRDLVQFF